MKLDLRMPTVVLAGAWNPAIFQPGWIARHVFGVPAGAEIKVTAVQMLIGQQQKLVTYIRDVGFAVSSNRLEIFAVEGSESAFKAAEETTARIVELLPHTPISAYGINFHFIEEHPLPGLLRKIRSCDASETNFDIAQETIISRINLTDSKTQLNIKRLNDGARVTFDFNFHTSEVKANALISEVHGAIKKCMEQALSIMKDIYGLSDYEVLVHEFDSTEAE